jgi:hypothetical protein
MLFASPNWRGLARMMPSLAKIMPSVEPSEAELISEVLERFGEVRVTCDLVDICPCAG